MLELDVVRLMMFLSRLESTMLDLGGGMHKMHVWISSSVLKSNDGVMSENLISDMAQTSPFGKNTLESWASLTLAPYASDCEDMVLCSQFDSEEALETLKVLELLRWLEDIGLKKVCLYDKEGVLKKSKEVLTLWLKSERMSKETTGDPLLEQKYISLEVISFSDSKHAIAKAANFLLKKHYLDANEKPQLTEPDMIDALEAIGYGTLEPDLMLIYGPARCHLGFPAWRSRYTEMVHMGPLKSTKFGAIVKAIHRFTTVHQNYGMYVRFNYVKLKKSVNQPLSD